MGIMATTDFLCLDKHSKLLYLVRPFDFGKKLALLTDQPTVITYSSADPTDINKIGRSRQVICACERAQRHRQCCYDLGMTRRELVPRIARVQQPSTDPEAVSLAPTATADQVTSACGSQRRDVQMPEEDRCHADSSWNGLEWEILQPHCTCFDAGLHAKGLMQYSDTKKMSNGKTGLKIHEEMN